MFVLKGSSTPRARGGHTGPREKSQSRQEIEDLTAALLENVKDYKSLEEGKADVLGCIDTLTQTEQMKRIRLTVEQISDLDELVKYIYNLRLKIEGLSVHKVLRGK